MKCFWGKILSTYNSSALFELTKDMLTSKWAMFKTHCQKFNEIHKHALCLAKSGENEMDALRHAKRMFRDENKGISFSQESSWEIFRAFPKWDAPDPVLIPTVNDEGTSGENVELFGENKRPRPQGACATKKMKFESSSGTAWSQMSMFAKTMSNELQLKRESQQEKDRIVIKFGALRFLTTKTDGLSPQDSQIIEMLKDIIRAKYRVE
uniref:No apical meristem-associated C-terminal domain-containing protein n=1 Tax=Tanacetum cinerariifolium TaxID=118510 RepID=A0A6L2K8H8_TANCI|nr:hypothetical protein [Tanacetum cinerariifolium]